MSTLPRILIAGIGNIFLGDDAFGVEVAQRLTSRPWPPSVEVVDFGIRGIDLAYALLEKYDVVIFVDAISRGETPGTLYLIEPEIPSADQPVTMDAHSLDPATVLRTAVSLGAKLPHVFIVGCEPGPLPGDDEVQMELSPAVAGAVGEAINMVESVVAKILTGEMPALSESMCEK